MREKKNKLSFHASGFALEWVSKSMEDEKSIEG